MSGSTVSGTRWDALALAAPAMPTHPTGLNFMEIGTADFETLANGEGRPPGVSVEAVVELQRRLRPRAGVTFVNAAVVGDAERRSGRRTAVVHLVPVTAARAHRLPKWIWGSNALIRPHREAVEYLARRNLLHLMTNRTVQTTSYIELVRNVSHLRYLKLDMEGSEAPVLFDVVDECRRRQMCPQYVRFERLTMLKTHAGKLAAHALEHAAGYRVDQCGRDCRFSRVDSPL